MQPTPSLAWGEQPTSGSKSERRWGSFSHLEPAQLDPIHEGTGLIVSCQLLPGPDHRPLAADLALVRFAFTRWPQAIPKGVLGVFQSRHVLDSDGKCLQHEAHPGARRLIRGAEFAISINPECDVTALGSLPPDLKAMPWIFPPDRLSWLDFSLCLQGPPCDRPFQRTSLEEALGTLDRLGAPTPLGLSKLHLLIHRTSGVA
jgi:hypothetical protein